jgi:hypothetical protein
LQTGRSTIALAKIAGIATEHRQMQLVCIPIFREIITLH